MASEKIPVRNEERTERMRARLLDATLDVILKEGWAKASTPKICKQAGVSRGAQTHHFPTKASLLAAALDWRAGQYEKKIVERLAAGEGHERTLRALLDGIWEAMLDDRFIQTGMEAMVAARTDPELRALLARHDTDAVRSMRDMADDIGADPLTLARVKDAIELSVYLFRGLVVQRGVHDDPKFRRDLYDKWCALVEDALAD
ncbi:TetR/AcrR family transcriptional regulator [Pyruvatibacter sp. HU-CL02332]|uniref:TetR/AcrR family transcriptional regulator n=1 Tax=Pyruvatibacter sp. HU-CL02332 TaxID=3127650 RepID=UPI003104A8F2